jgi:hypothetical protein
MALEAPHFHPSGCAPIRKLCSREPAASHLSYYRRITGTMGWVTIEVDLSDVAPCWAPAAYLEMALVVANFMPGARAPSTGFIPTQFAAPCPTYDR